MFRRLITIAAFLATAALGSTCLGAVYVDGSASGPVFNGASWATAYRTIGEAVSAAPASASIWVRTGVYKERLVLNKFLNLYGGFLGYETSTGQRLPGAFPTIIDAIRKGRVIDIPMGQFIVLDGFTLRNGRGDQGGGIRIQTNADAKIDNCRFEYCKATVSAGGVYFGKYATGEMNDSVILGCEAPNGGGGVIEYHCYPYWRRILIIRNHATVSGGGVHCPFHSGAYLLNCTLAYNTADLNGGAVYAHYGGPEQFFYSILAFNSAPEGGGIYGGGGSSQATIDHCCFYSNAGGDLGGAIPPPPEWRGNFSADPLFLLPDYDEFLLTAGSPCDGVGVYPLEPIYRLTRIGLARFLPDGAQVSFAGKIVSGVDGGTFYIQDHDRSAAIAVKGIAGYQRGDVLAGVGGVLSSSIPGKRYLAATSSALHVSGFYTLRPLGVRVGLLSTRTGLCVRTWGRAENVTPAGFILRDGFSTVPVRYTGAVQQGAYYSVTGVYTNQDDFLASDLIAR